MRLQPENQAVQNKEVFMIWTHLGSNNGFLAANQFFLNHVEDRTLKKVIHDFTECLQDENKHLDLILKKKGITLNPSFSISSNQKNEALLSNENRTDLEISAALSMNIATSLVTTSKALGQATSEYTLLMYGHYHMKKAVLGAQLLQLSKDKCWLVV